MTAYELITEQLKDPLFYKMMQKGVISIHILTYKNYYDLYLSEMKKGIGKMQSFTNVAEEYDCSVSTVRRAVAFMES